MGKANFGISLENQNEPVYAGSHLKGVVFANVETEIKGSQMTVQFFGQEKTKVRYTHRSTDAEGNTRFDTRYADASRNLVSVGLPVDNLKMIQQGRIPPGKYELPFDIELPASLPSSMYESYNDGHYRIRYWIKAVLKGSGFLSNYSCEQEVQVKAKPLDTDPIPYNAPPVTEAVRLCCCINRGWMTFGAKVDDTRLDREASTKVSFSCRNNTTVRVEKVDAKLIQRCSWQAGSHHESITRVLSTIDFGSFSGLERKDRQLNENRGISDFEKDEIFREVEAGLHSGTVTMPMIAHNTYKGSIMSCEHWIDVQVYTGCCVDNPLIHIPVQSGETTRGAPAAGTATAPLVSTQMPEGFSDEATISNTISVASSAATIGGSPVEGDEEPDVLFAPLSTSAQTTPCLANLLKEMEDSVADLDIINAKIKDPDWKPIFDKLSPSDYAQLISKTDSDFDQPLLAMTVARQIPQFSCEYVVAAIRATSDWNRSAVVEKLLPFCHDLASNQQLIRNELTDWEKLCTERAFANALQR